MFLSNMFSGLKRGIFGNGTPGGRNDASKSLAKSRLQFVLVQDRAGMSSDEMGKFKHELVSVIEKYFKIEKDKFDITYKRAGDSTTLLINSPVMIRRTAADYKNDNKQKSKDNKDNKNRGPERSMLPVVNS